MLPLLYITDSEIKVSIWVYLDGVWCTIHSRGMSKWIYWDYIFAWCTKMGSMKN